MIEPLKYLLQAVAYERDAETGRVLREIPSETLIVYTADQAAQTIMLFEQSLAAQQNGGAVPVETETVTNISCDNPSCPGNDLDPHERTGWTFVSTEVYGQPGTQFVYCSADCAGTVGDALTAQTAEPSPLETA
jgi:hypothetical protein